MLRGISKEMWWWAERPWDQLQWSTFSCTAFPSAHSPGALFLWALLPTGVKLQQRVLRLDTPPPPQEAFLTARSPWDAEWKLPGRSISQKVANGGVPVRVKDAAVARQRLLFSLGVWL